jgi:hypothetical protein
VSSAPDEWLLQEALDHLSVDSMGVYELLWLVRGSGFQLDETAARNLARDVVNRLVSDGAAELVILKWPTNEVIVGDPSNIDIGTDVIFEPNSAGEYLALTSASRMSSR